MLSQWFTFPKQNPPGILVRVLQKPQPEAGGRGHSSEDAHVPGARLGPPAGANRSSLCLDERRQCLGLFFFWHLQNRLTAKWRNGQSSSYCMGKRNEPPAGGTGEERGVRHFQLSQCCVVAGMRNDLPLLKPLTLRYFLLLRPDGES